MDKKQFEELKNLSEKLDKQRQFASELLRTAQDRFNEVVIEIERNGKKQRVKQKDLWREVYELGINCEAAQYLKEKHPKVFGAYDEEYNLAQQFNTKVFELFGVAKANQVTFMDIVSIIETVIDLKLKDNKNEK